MVVLGCTYFILLLFTRFLIFKKKNHFALAIFMNPPDEGARQLLLVYSTLTWPQHWCLLDPACFLPAFVFAVSNFHIHTLCYKGQVIKAFLSVDCRVFVCSLLALDFSHKCYHSADCLGGVLPCARNQCYGLGYECHMMEQK